MIKSKKCGLVSLLNNYQTPQNYYLKDWFVSLLVLNGVYLPAGGYMQVEINNK